MTNINNRFNWYINHNTFKKHQLQQFEPILITTRQFNRHTSDNIFNIEILMTKRYKDILLITRSEVNDKPFEKKTFHLPT